MDRKPETVIGCAAVRFDFNSPHFTIPNAYSAIINRYTGCAVAVLLCMTVL